MKDQSLPQQSRNSGRECAWWTNSLVGQYIHQLSLEQSSRCRQSHGQDIFLLSFFSGGTSLCFTDQETQEENVHTWWTNSLVGQYLNQLSLAHSSRSIQSMQTVPWPKQFFFSFFLGRRGLFFADQETQKENVLGGPTPLRVSNTPAISCTKFKIHSVHADSPMAKTVFSSVFSGRTSLCFTNQETQEENMLGGPAPLWVKTYTSYLLYKVQDPFSTCRQSHGQNSLFFSVFFREDQSLLHKPRNSGRECAWWTNSLVGQYLHQLSLVQSSRSIQSMQTVPWSKQFFSQFF